MKSTLKAALAGAAALLLSAGFVPALAGDGQPHVMSVRMPDGNVAQITYFGDVPPRVVVAPAPVAVAAQPFEAPIGFGPSLAALQRWAAMMDRQAELMMREAVAMQEAVLNGGLPVPAQGYMASTSPGAANVCMRSVQVTYNGDGPPQVVSHSSGNCGRSDSVANPNTVTAPAPVVPARQNRPRTIEVKADTSRPALAMAQPALADR